MKWKMVSNQSSNTIDNIEDITFIESQSKMEGFVEVSEDTSTSNLETDRQDINEMSEITLTIISVQL